MLQNDSSLAELALNRSLIQSYVDFYLLRPTARFIAACGCLLLVFSLL